MLVMKKHEEVQYSRWYVDTCVLGGYVCVTSHQGPSTPVWRCGRPVYIMYIFNI